MRGRKAAVTVYLSDDERQELQGLLRRQKTPLGLARRARAMLLLEQGLTYVQAAAQAGLSVRHLRKWANRFVPCRTPGLLDRPRPGRPPVFSPPRWRCIWSRSPARCPRVHLKEVAPHGTQAAAGNAPNTDACSGSRLQRLTSIAMGVTLRTDQNIPGPFKRRPICLQKLSIGPLEIGSPSRS